MMCLSGSWQRWVIAYTISLFVFVQMVVLSILSSQVGELQEESLFLERQLQDRFDAHSLIRSPNGAQAESSEKNFFKESSNNSDQYDDAHVDKEERPKKPNNSDQHDDAHVDIEERPKEPDGKGNPTYYIALRLLRMTPNQPKVENSKLPIDEDIIDLYDPKHPVIYGKDTCNAYRNAVPPENRIVAPAGLFNTGTNLVHELLKKNCKNTNVNGGHSPGQRFVEDGVPWGKHIPPWWRDVWLMNPTRGSSKNRRKDPDPEKTPEKPKILQRFQSSRRRLRQTKDTREHYNRDTSVQYPHVPKNNVFPVVTIKDPYTWMQSMCRHPYSLVWMHDPDHCPNLVPNKIDVKRRFASSASDKSRGIPVQINYRQASAFSYYDSMAHLWNEWNTGYLDDSSFTHPRMMIRFEDLVFNPEPVIREICECVGGTMNKNFAVLARSAKGSDGSHAGSSGLLGAMQRYGSKAKRIEKFEEGDLKYAQEYLDPKLMKTFGYKDPSSYGV